MSTNALGNLTAPLFFLPGFVPGHSSSKYILLDTVLANCQSILHVLNVLKILHCWKYSNVFVLTQHPTLGAKICCEMVRALGAEIIIRMKCRLQDFKYFGQV